MTQRRLLQLLLVMLLLIVSFNRAALSNHSVTILGEPGTMIYVDERFRGELNNRGVLRLNRISDGHIRLRAEKRGFSSFESVYMINADRTIVLELVSTRRFPFLSQGIASHPFAVFFFILLLAIPLFWKFYGKSIQRYFHRGGSGNSGEKQPDYVFMEDNLIGKGGMAHLYHARSASNGNTVALKLLNKELVGDEDIIKKFRKEAAVLKKIRDSYKDVPVVRYVDEGKLSDGRLFIAMEYLDGKSLQWYLKQHVTFTVQDMVDIAMQILQGLYAAHSLGILHNDLTPDNVIARQVDKKWIIKIIDFGVAKLNSSDFLTRGDIFGKPCYMAPEAADGKPSVQSDLYSLGVILFHLVEGNPPFDDTNPITVYHQHKTQPVPDISRPVPNDLKKLIAYLMKKKPDERPENALDVINLLGNININQ